MPVLLWFTKLRRLIWPLIVFVVQTASLNKSFETSSGVQEPQWYTLLEDWDLASRLGCPHGQRNDRPHVSGCSNIRVGREF